MMNLLDSTTKQWSPPLSLDFLHLSTKYQEMIGELKIRGEEGGWEVDCNHSGVPFPTNRGWSGGGGGGGGANHPL